MIYLNSVFASASGRAPSRVDCLRIIGGPGSGSERSESAASAQFSTPSVD